MAKHKHNLPEILIPEGDLCVPLFIPHDTEYVSLVVRALRQLTLDRHYDRDENHSALIVREQFDTRMYQPLIEALINGTPCSDESDDNSHTCFRMDATTEAFNFYPNDPFIASDFFSEDIPVIALGYQWHRWGEVDRDAHPWAQWVGDSFSDAVGYYPNDIMIVPSRILDFALINLAELVSLIIFQTFPFPYIRYDFVGSGTADVELLNFPLGCSVLLIPDMELSYSGLLQNILNVIDNGEESPLDWIWTEVNRDFAQIPPETASTQGQKISFDDDGEHNLHVIFIPRINDEIPFFFPFGGIREIQVCGDMKIIGSQTGEQIDKINAGLHSRSDLIMATTEEICAGMLCAMETVAQRILLASQAENIENDVIIGARDDGSGYETAIDKTSNIIAPEFETTSQEIANGGAYHQAMQFKKAFDDLNANVTANWAEVTLDKVLSYFLGLQTLATFGMISYKADDPQVTIDVNLLAEQIYCSGGFQTGIFEYSAENHTEDDFGWIIDMANEIPNSTLSSWYKNGLNSPRNDYLNYACYRQPMLEGIVDFSEYTSSAIGNIIFQQNAFADRNWRLEFSGKFVDVNGQEYDGVFLKDTNDSLTRNQIKIVKSQQADATATNLPAYNTSNYALTYSMPTKSPDGVWTPQAFTPVSGSMTFKLYDLGAI